MNEHASIYKEIGISGYICRKPKKPKIHVDLPTTNQYYSLQGSAKKLNKKIKKTFSGEYGRKKKYRCSLTDKIYFGAIEL